MSAAAEALARALLAARREHAALDPRAWQSAVPDAEAAYAVQQAVVDGLAAPAVPAPGGAGSGGPTCWKSGGPSREQVLTHAPLPAHGVHASPADLSGVPNRLRIVEAEIALRLARDVPPQEAADLPAQEVEALVDALCVSIEIVDTRWSDFGAATPLLKLADLQSHGALVLGAWSAYRRRDWAAQRCELRIGSQPPILRVGSHPLGEPLWGLPAWLRHATRHGATVRAGTVVTTGSWVGMPAAQAGDEVVAAFEGIGEARVRL